MDVESGIHRHGIRNPQRGIRNPRLPWITLHRAIREGMRNLLNVQTFNPVTCITLL